MASSILFVINPGSGAEDVDWEQEIKTYCEKRDILPLFFWLEQPINCAVLERHLQETKAHKVVAIGGDGTVNLVAQFLTDTGIPLGIIPGGSANGMAKELMIPQQLDKALAIIETGKVVPVDTILINNKHICLHLSDMGMNAQLIKNFEAGHQRGKMGYAKVVLKTLRNKRQMILTLATPQHQIQRTAIMVVIANAGKYGTGAVINPDGAIDDQLFEVIVVKRMPIVTILRMLFSKKFDPKNVETFQCQSVSIRSKKKIHFQIDGEYLGTVRQLEAVIQPHNLLLILPEAYVNKTS